MMNKRKNDSATTKECQYGLMCCRLNPDHFEQYRHPHLEQLLNYEKSDAGNSAGPSRDIVQQQLEIIRSKRQNQASTSENFSRSLKQIKSEVVSQPEIKQEEVLNITSDVQSILETPKEVKAEAKVSSNSIADFFKERSRLFAAKEEPKSQNGQKPPVPVALVLPIIKPELKRFIPVVLPRGQMAQKLKNAAPYSIFLTTVASSSATHSDPLSVTFLELLDPSLGELESSVQLNFVVQIDWLVAQYAAAGLHKLPLLILHGEDEPAIANYSRVLPNVTSTMVKVPGAIGCHHAKVMLFFYKDKSMRVVISTANLYQDDWDNRVQGMWISERLPALSDGAGSGESVTGFRTDLIRFLEHYGHPQLQAYIGRVKKSDFSSVNVFLMSSIPGRHRNDSHGHLRLASLLKRHSAPVDSKFPIIMQSSALGNFGKAASEYLTGEIARSFQCSSGPSNAKTPEVKLMYPSLKNVTESHDGLMGGGCLPYFRDAHNRQLWLNQYLYQWRSQSRNRDRAMPHIKSYCRYSDDGLFWFVLTSANMSKSAWGVTKGSLNINSYELGVAFFPRVVLGQDHDHFPLNESQQKDGAPLFKLPFDIPLQPYGPEDQPFCIEDMRQYQRELMAMQGSM